MVYGNTYNLKIAVANGNKASQNLDTIVKSEKLIKIVPTVDLHVLITAKSSTTDPDANDFLLKANIEYEFPVGTGMDKISFWNASGGDGHAYVMVMY
jgi:hypothetical protein